MKLLLSGVQAPGGRSFRVLRMPKGTNICVLARFARCDVQVSERFAVHGCVCAEGTRYRNSLVCKRRPLVPYLNAHLLESGDLLVQLREDCALDGLLLHLPIVLARPFPEREVMGSGRQVGQL